MKIEIKLHGDRMEVAEAWAELQEKAASQTIDKMVIKLQGPIFVESGEWDDPDPDLFPGRITINAHLVVGDGISINLIPAGSGELQ